MPQNGTDYLPLDQTLDQIHTDVQLNVDPVDQVLVDFGATEGNKLIEDNQIDPPNLHPIYIGNYSKV